MHLYPFFMNHHHLFPSDPFSVSTTLLPGGLSNTNEIPASRPVFPGWFLVKVPLGAPRVSVLLRVLQAGIPKEDPPALTFSSSQNRSSCTCICAVHGLFPLCLRFLNWLLTTATPPSIRPLCS